MTNTYWIGLPNKASNSDGHFEPQVYRARNLLFLEASPMPSAKSRFLLGALRLVGMTKLNFDWRYKLYTRNFYDCRELIGWQISHQHFG
jgi:hypothetical protein